MIKSENKTLGTICAAVSSVIFGFSFLFSSTALSKADVFVVLSWRFIVSILCLSLLLPFKPFRVNFKKSKNLWQLLLLGLIQPVLYFVCEQYGIVYTNTAISGVFCALNPVMVMYFSAVFLKEKPTLMQIVFGLISLIGVTVISFIGSSQGQIKWFGILFLIGSIITSGFYNVLSRKLRANYSPMELTFAMFLIGAVVFTSIGAIKLRGSFISQMLTPLLDKDFMFSILYLSVFSSVVGFLLYSMATSNVTVVISSSFANVGTVVALLAGVFILKETLTPVQIVCCVIIILGVLGVNLSRKTRQNTVV